MNIAEVRQKWNRRYLDKMTQGVEPVPNPLALRFAEHVVGGTMLDAACGMGSGMAAVIDRGERAIAVDISDNALAAARRHWGSIGHKSPHRQGDPRGETRADDSPYGKIRWIQADVSRLNWPDDYFNLVCTFGFTDWTFLRQVPAMVRPGGLFFYQGFSRRQLTVKPNLHPDWTSTPEEIAALFPGWRVLALEESEAPPYRVGFAGMRPATKETEEAAPAVAKVLA